jgi:hypothetical protein
LSGTRCRTPWSATRFSAPPKATACPAPSATTASAPHTYAYDTNLMFPADPWRALPDISADNPDDQPITP